MDKTFPAIFAWLILKINILKEDCHLLYYPLVRNCDTDFYGATTLSIMTFSMTLSIKGLFVALSIKETKHVRHTA
jgi:hypothetical protein